MQCGEGERVTIDDAEGNETDLAPGELFAIIAATEPILVFFQRWDSGKIHLTLSEYESLPAIVHDWYALYQQLKNNGQTRSHN